MMKEEHLKHCEALMSRRDHNSLIALPGERQSLYLELADEVPSLVAEVRRLNLHIEDLEKLAALEGEGIAFLKEDVCQMRAACRAAMEFMRDRAPKNYAAMETYKKLDFAVRGARPLAEAQNPDRVICGWCGGTGKAGPRGCEGPCRRCLGSGDPTKPTPGVQSS